MAANLKKSNICKKQRIKNVDIGKTERPRIVRLLRQTKKVIHAIHAITIENQLCLA